MLDLGLWQAPRGEPTLVVRYPGTWGGLISQMESVAGVSCFYGFDQAGNTRILVAADAGQGRDECYYSK